MGLTFCIGDLLRKPKTPPSLLKNPCEACGKAEAKRNTFGESVSFGRLEQVKVCVDCFNRVESDD